MPELDVVMQHRVRGAGVVAEAALRRPLSRVVHHVEPVAAPKYMHMVQLKTKAGFQGYGIKQSRKHTFAQLYT